MAIAYATAGGTILSADRVRTESLISCEPGKDTRSGGLPISAVRNVAAAHHVILDYGGTPPKVWPAAELERRLLSGWGAIVLGDYEAAPDRVGSFLGDHSAFVHGTRRDAAGHIETHWHDPLWTAGRWELLSAVVRYWRFIDAVGGNVAGYAGFVLLPPRGPVLRNAAGWADLRAGDPFYRSRGAWSGDYPVKVGPAQRIEVGGPRWASAEHSAKRADGSSITVRRISSIKGDVWLSAWIPSPTRHLTPVR
jgi:hypothetical protein